jgi:hypothetical protein
MPFSFVLCHINRACKEFQLHEQIFSKNELLELRYISLGFDETGSYSQFAFINELNNAPEGLMYSRKREGQIAD